MNPNKTYQNLKNIMLAIFGGLFLFIVIAYYLLKNGILAGDAALTPTFRVIIPILAAGGLLASYLLGKSNLEKAKKQSDLEMKMAAFQQTQIIKNALLEAPGLFCVVSAAITGEIQFLFIALAILIVMLIGFPKKDKMMDLLELSAADRAKFNQ